MKKITTLAVISLLLANGISAQNVGIGTNTPDVSALLDITATNKGLLIPRVSLTGLTDAVTIATPATGLIVYNTNAAVPGGVGFYYNSGTTAAASWAKFVTGSGGGSGWALTGNAGTDSTVNFIGTTDAKPLTFRVNNGYAGMIGSTGLIAIGRGAVGTEFTPDPGVIAIGDSALFNNSQDFSEIAIGNLAMYSNSTPGDGDNVAIGNLSMLSSTSGSQNVAMGWGSLALNDAGSQNVAIGHRAAVFSGGDQNTVVGAFALDNDQSAGRNTAIGFATMNENFTGVDNVAVGHLALVNNDIGLQNTGVGARSLQTDSTGFNNTGLGFKSGQFINTGNDNIAIGAVSMRTVTAGSNNICIGDSADVVPPLAGQILNNAIAIGKGSIVNASNKVVVGNTSHTSIGGNVGWTTFSDGRYKTDVEENVSGLNFIMKLRPVTYHYDFNKINSEFQLNSSSAGSLNSLPLSSRISNSKFSGKLASFTSKRPNNLSLNNNGPRTGLIATPAFPNPNEGVRFTGFIAQEVEAAAKKAGYDFSGVDKPATPGANYGLRYSDFVVPLVKAMQEQQSIIDAQNKKIEELTKRLEKLETKN